MVHDFVDSVSNRILLDSLPSPFFMTDLNMNVMFVNKAAAEFFSIQASSVIGQPCNIYFRTVNCDTINCCIKRFKENYGSITEIIDENSKFCIYTSNLIDQDGQHIGYSCFTLDTSEVQQKEKLLKIKEERFRLTKPYYNCGIWEYDTYEKSLRRDSASNDDFKIPDTIYNVPESMISAGWFHSRSVEDIRNIFKLLDEGEPFVECEIAVIKKPGEVLWYRISGTNVFDDSHTLIKTIGISQDITKQKADALKAERERRDLLDEINRDPLTGLINRSHMIEKIEDYLKNKPHDSAGALMVINVDDFRLINNCHGYHKGDEFLKKMADLMRGFFRESDWLCRISADEFLIFMCEGEESGIREKAGLFCGKAGELGNEYQHIDIPPGTIGVSIGITMINEERVDFHELYRYADKALFVAKSKGKKGFAMYGEF